jgi:CDP-diacylglycerol---serine O-phosphatidyltransferase
MDPTDPSDDRGSRRRLRRRRRLFRHSKIPVKMLVPNFFTLLSLCAGVTSIRMAIEQRYDIALLLIVLAALIDGIDGRLARALKAQSRLGAELDSLADFVNFGIAPAIVVYTWGLGGLRDFGWVAVLVFACCMGLRLARFNSMLDSEKPKWQSNYFTGVPAPAGAIVVLLPLYVDALGLFEVRSQPKLIAIYTLMIAGLLVSTLPTFSGKLLGERIKREWVPPIFGGLALSIGLLVTYPHATMTVVVLAYLALIPLSWRRYQENAERDANSYQDGQEVVDGAPTTPGTPSQNVESIPPPTVTKH